jgi:hypothetical protein
MLRITSIFASLAPELGRAEGGGAVELAEGSVCGERDLVDERDCKNVIKSDREGVGDDCED